MKDLYNNLKVSRAISPTRVANNTAQVSQIIDMQGFRALMFVIAMGTLADADATFTLKIEESDASDLAGSNEVADADLHGTEAEGSFIFSDDDEVRKIGYRGVKRYVRLTITPADNEGNADISVTAIQGHADIYPIA